MKRKKKKIFRTESNICVIERPKTNLAIVHSYCSSSDLGRMNLREHDS
jgi:hypothetical protein